MVWMKPANQRWRWLRKLESRPGESVVIREAQDDRPERLRRWRDLGLTPGTTVRVVSYHPLDDLYELDVAGRVVRLGREGVAGLFGESAEMA